MKQTTITIDYARQKLGKKGEKMTDEQIHNLLSTLRLLCNKTIDLVVEKNKSN